MTDASLFFEFCGICDGGNEAQWCFQFITMAIASALQTNIAFVSVCGSGLCRRTAWMGSLHLHLLLAFLGLPDRRKVEFIKKKKVAISLNHLLSLNSNGILSVRDCVSLIHTLLGNHDILLALD